MTIARGMAYDEPFSEATAALRFEGDGVRLDGIEMRKGGGTVTGAAYVGWNGTYSFNVDGRGIAVETLDADDVSRATRRSTARSISPRTAAAPSRSRATTSSGASAICSSATKASAK